MARTFFRVSNSCGISASVRPAATSSSSTSAGLVAKALANSSTLRVIVAKSLASVSFLSERPTISSISLASLSAAAFPRPLPNLAATTMFCMAVKLTKGRGI
ncbi:hypothetical protein ES708_28166 [subsurface metagenome]